MNESSRLDSIDDLNIEDLMEVLSPICEPVHVISGSGWAWFLDPETLTMSRVMRGTEVILISTQSDNRDRIIVESPFGLLMVPEKEVSEIGWN